MKLHHPTPMLNPFTGHVVDIDDALAPIIERQWEIGTETTNSRQGEPVYSQAVICFAEPKSFDESQTAGHLTTTIPRTWAAGYGRRCVGRQPA